MDILAVHTPGTLEPEAQISGYQSMKNYRSLLRNWATGFLAHVTRETLTARLARADLVPAPNLCSWVAALSCYSLATAWTVSLVWVKRCQLWRAHNVNTDFMPRKTRGRKKLAFNFIFIFLYSPSVMTGILERITFYGNTARQGR